MNITIVTKNGTGSGRRLANKLGWHVGTRGADLIVNYGKAGAEAAEFWGRYPIANTKPCINKEFIANKRKQCELADKACRANLATDWVEVPLCSSYRNLLDLNDVWIAKPFYGGYGRGIVPIEEYNNDGSKYFQKRIMNRRYELRVHAFMWQPIEEWRVHKKIHPDGNNQLTWNHHTGGKFITVNDHNRGVFLRAKQAAQFISSDLNFQFTGMDFIVDDNMKLWFLEGNSCPGFTELSEGFYVQAFKDLKTLAETDFEKVMDIINNNQQREEDNEIVIEENVQILLTKCIGPDGIIEIYNDGTWAYEN